MQSEVLGALTEEDALYARQFFLTILLENAVESYGIADITPVCPPSKRVHVDGTAIDEDPERRSPPYRDYPARKHVRIVFKECGQCMRDVRDIRNAFQCLQGCAKGAFVAFVERALLLTHCTALFYMKKAGFVHRGVSAENCYYYNGSGILGDLEYAKRFGNLSGSEARTVRLPSPGLTYRRLTPS